MTTQKATKGYIANVYDILLVKPEKTECESSLLNILGTITNMRPSCALDEDEKQQIVTLQLVNEMEVEIWNWLTYCV